MAKVSKNGSFAKLPDGYENIYTLNLQKDKKTTLLVNGISLLIMVLCIFAGMLFAYNSEIVIFDGNLVMTLLKLCLLSVGMCLYLVLHEAVHGLVMKYYGAKKIKFGFTGLYAFAGCDDYFKEKPYIAIALAPIVFFGVILTIICLLVPNDWFLFVYLIQVCNLSGAAGDLYVTYKFCKMPKDILINDTGLEMNVYSNAQQK